jgi:chromosome segregation ATPase
LKAQLLEYNTRFNLIAKENKRLEKRNAEILNTIKKSTDEYNELQIQLREIKEKSAKVTIERTKCEQQNREVEEDIVTAKKALRDLQSLFRTVQESADNMKKKHSGRDDEFNTLLTQNKKLKGTVVELEWKLKDAESSLQLMTASKDEAIRKVQSQISDTNEILLSTKEEIVRLRHEKTKRENELEEWKERSRDRIEQLHNQFDRRIEQYLDDAVRSKLASVDYSGASASI